ncbi:MAG: hypothetical protein ABL934_19440 [Lysobacteraceae bacterium]
MNKLLIFLALFFACNAFASDDVRYWNEWHKKTKNVSTCSSIKGVTAFLKSAISNLGNAERTEANAEVIENLAIENPDCFNTSLSGLSKTDCRKILEFFIEAPVYNDAELIKTKLKTDGCYAS